jgi:hypothetical protein
MRGNNPLFVLQPGFPLVLAQRNAVHHRDARPQSKLFAPSTSRAETQPRLRPLLLRLSAMISQSFTHTAVFTDC